MPGLSTWYLSTNLPRPGSPQTIDSPIPPADLAEIVRCYALRNWVEQSYKQVKGELGWADFQVRSDRAIRRHWHLVWCAFSFCWRAWFARQERNDESIPDALAHATAEAGQRGRGGNHPFRSVLAARLAPGQELARSLDFPLALVAGVVRSAPAP